MSNGVRLAFVFLLVGLLLGAGATAVLGYRLVLTPERAGAAAALAEAQRLGDEAQASYERIAGRLGSIADGAGDALKRVERIADLSQRIRERNKVYEGIYRELVAIADELDQAGAGERSP